MLLALFVARIHCRVTLSLLSTKTQSLSLRAPCYQPLLLQRVFLSSVRLYICPCWVSLGLLAQCSSLSVSVWMATLPLTVLTWLTYWCICKSSEVVLCHWFKLDSMCSLNRTCTCSTPFVTGLQLQYDPFVTIL